MLVLQDIILIQMMGNLDNKKTKKNLSVWDIQNENETHSAGEDFIGVSGITIECNNLQSVSEITELIFDWPK